MKSSPLSRFLFFVVFATACLQGFAQNIVPFTSKPGINFNEDLKGDILTIGNTVLGPSNDPVNTNIGNNSNVNMRHIDIDGDDATFNSSSAELLIPNPNCFEIKHATLFWGAVNPPEADTDNDLLRQIKFKGPTGGYSDIVGDIIYRDETTALNTAYPYACRADVLDIVNAQPSALGYYTVANLQTRTGVGNDESPRNVNGNTAGWSLFIVYEDPTLPSKSITSLDGFSAIFRGQAAVDIPVSGFRTLPAPQPVRANLAFATLEGDLSLGGDRMSLNGTNLSSADRPVGNFFRSRVTQLDALPVNNRIPNSSNTLGFDTGVLQVPNPGNNVINNGDTSAIMSLTTNSDFFLQYFFAFAVEIIEPDIVLTKLVEDEFGNDISDQVVNLGQPLTYVISFQNVGNDDAQGFFIEDVLPINTIFNYPADLILPAGVTARSYDAPTRTLILDIEDYLVEEGDPAVEFRIRAQVVENCDELADACTNLVQNSAYASYSGTISDITVEEEGSVNTDTGCLLIPQATNFLADVDACEYEETVVLCGDSIQITAANGYDTYEWSRNPSGTPVFATTQTITVTESGTYYVSNTAPAPCQSIIQIFDVITYGENQTNPIIPQADEVVICPDDGKQLPNIFLCGLNDSRELDASIADANSIIWEQLDETSCPAVDNINCGNEDGSCTWNQVATGANYTVNTAGQFRLTVNYDGGCFNQFFFNVYQNLLDPDVDVTDVLCDTLGSITVNNVPSNYEYSLDGITYQDSNVFPIAVGGTYTVYIKQKDVPDGACIFTVPDVLVRERDFTFDIDVTQPACNGDRGTIQVAAYDGEPQYTFSIFEGGVLVNTVGPIIENSYLFENLGAGTYTSSVETEDGCTDSREVTITEPELLTVTADLTTPFLDCLIPAVDSDGNPILDEDGNPVFEDPQGEITMNTTGGTPPYVYFINSTTEFQSDPVYQIDSAGTYNIRVVDSNNCEATATIEVEEILPPDFTVTPSNVPCANSGDNATITFNVTNTFGSSLEYSIDNGATYANSPVFTNLAPGTYEAVIRYTFGPSSCVTPPRSVTITSPSQITGIATASQDYTCTTEAEITVTNVSGGTPPYTYSIDGVNFQTSNVFTGLTEGSYSVVIQDANNCTFTTDAVIIAQLDPPTDLAFSSTPLTCPLNTSDVTLTASGGVNPLEYRIIAPAPAATGYQTSNVFSSLASGTYTFEVRDANQCTYSESYTINSLPPISVTAQSQSDVSCLGGNDGEILLTVSGTTTFEYTVNGGAVQTGTSPITLDMLSADTYNFVIRDTVTNCEATATAVINDPATALDVTAVENPITCVDGGSVTITATGGWGGYTYTLTQPDGSIEGPQSNNVFTNLGQSGTYTVTVEDINGCQDDTTFDLSTPDAIAATISTASDLCYSSTDAATLEVTVSSGEAPFEYSMNGGPFGMSNIFDNLTPGTYTIVVRDALGCTTTLPASIIAQELTVSTVITDNLDCTASPDAIITGTITDGYAPYNYAVSIDGSLPYTAIGTVGTAGTPGATFTYSSGIAGTYQFQVTDAQGCIAESGITTIAAITSPTATADPVDPLCFNDTNGEVQLLAAGGSGDYLFSFNGSAFTTQSLYNNLSANITYNYQVQDSNECLSPIYTITLNNPTEVEASASIPANTTCEATTVITASATGGTGSYVYSFEGSSFGTSNTFTVANTTATQSITYAVRDTNGCIDTKTIDVPPYDPPTGITFANANAITCNNTTTAVTVTPTGGIAPFTFAITAPAGATGNVSGASSGVFTGLAPGNYTFEITDANGCSLSASHTIAPVTNIAVAGVSADELCFTQDNGQATFTVTNVSSPGNFTYTMTPASGTDSQAGNIVSVTGLAAGTYTFDVVDSTTGCSDTTSVTVNAATEITFSTAATNVNCNNSISTISFPTLTGGTPAYTYAFVTSGSPAPALGAYSTTTTVDTSILGLTIDVYVKDANDCTVMLPHTIIGDPAPTVTVNVDNQCAVPGGNYTITAVASSGIAPYTYSIDGTNFQSSATFSVLPGTYTITVSDTNGCTASDTVTVYPQLTISPNLDKVITCSLPQEAQVTLTANGGNTPAYTYAFSTDGGVTYNAMASNVFNTTTPGSYIFRVTDANSCEATTTANIDLATPVNPDIAVAQTAFINCNGEETAAISITPDVSLGQAPYIFNVFNTTTGVPYGTQTSGLSAGDYTITVTDDLGCTGSENISILEPDPLVLAFSTVDITCNASGVSQGAINIDSVTGGTAPYDYFVTGTNGYSDSELNATGATPFSFDVIDFGLYQINIVDDNGCSILEQDVLVASPPTDLDIIIDSSVDCATGGEAVVSVNSSLGSAGPFFFDIYQGFIPPPPPGGTWQAEDTPGSGSTTFTGLTPGVTYTFIVYDASTMCTYFELSTLPIPTDSTLAATAVSSNNITCTGSADGNVSFTINSIYGAPVNVTYEIFDSLSLITTGISGTGVVPAGGNITVSDLGPLPFGNYYVLISETSGSNLGCGIVTAPFNITESALNLSLTASVSSNENCNTLGVISATASDGTAPYQYQILLETDTAPSASSASWASANTFNVAANSYTVYTIDAYGCIRDFDIDVIRDAEPVIDPQAAPCFEGSPINITITGGVSVGTPTYSINGTTFVSDPNFTFYTAGTYTLYIQDGNGCVATTPFVLNDQLQLSAELTKVLDCTASPDAEITLAATGGDITSYTYEVSTDGGATYAFMGSNIFTTNIAGTYFFRVADAAGCPATTTYTLDPIPTIVFGTVETDVSCNGGSDGTITVNVTAGVGPFQYQLDGGPLQSSNIFPGLSQGTTYIVTVTDDRSCTRSSLPITINEPTALTALEDVSANMTCDVETTITITGQNGTPTGVDTGYLYNFNGIGFTTNNTFTVNDNGTVQTITYIVKDANGCEFPGTITVDPLDPPTDLDFNATAITCLISDSTVTLTATGGIAPLSYEILSPAAATTNTTGATSGVFTGLVAGDYIFQVTDDNGCAYQELYTVEDVENITVIGQLISDVTCNPGANGEVVFNIANFTGTYSYAINGAATVTGQTNPTVTVSGITGPGTQTIVITDEVTGCPATTFVDVSQPAPLNLTLDTNINATCNMGAQVSVTASGGVAPYSYSFVISGDPAGTFSSSNSAILDPAISTSWDVYVQDGNMCVITPPLTVNIATDPLPSGISVPSLSQCPDDVTGDYTFTVDVASGIPPYEFSIGNGFQSSPTFTVNTPGTYDVTVRDANGCINTAPFTFDILPALQLDATISEFPSCDDDDGEITIVGSGGSGTYTYVISPSPASISFAGNVFSGVPSGTYTITMTDTVTSCDEEVTVTLEAATLVTFDPSAIDVSCNGGSDGTITIDLLPGNDNPLYTYEIIAPITRPAQTSNIFTGLASDTYTVRVNSGRGCSETANVLVDQPTLLTVSGASTDFACAADNSVNTATVTITATGGTPTYLYSIDDVDYFTSSTFDIIDTGATQTINVFVKDDKGCVAMNTLIVNPLDAITAATVTESSPLDCNGTGELMITVTGGSGNFTYQLLPDGTPQTSNTFALSDPGTYFFQVNDLDTGCYFLTDPFVVDPFDTIEAQITTAQDVDCLGNNIGEIELVVNGYTGAYTYQLFDSSGTPVGGLEAGNTISDPQLITGLPGGNYSVSVTATDSPFCTADSNVENIATPTEALILDASETFSVTCTNDQGVITAIGSGGTPPYEYELLGPDPAPYSLSGTFEGLSAGSYTVNVRDANGCMDTRNVLLEVPDAITATFTPSTTLLSCFGDRSASITITAVMGGQGSDYNYTLNRISPDPSTFGPQTSNVFNDLGAGVYSVTISDPLTCSLTSADITINEPTQIDASLVLASTQTCLNDATLTLSATGGTPPYDYSATADFSAVLGTFTSDITFDAAAGSYEFYVRDSNGCIEGVFNEISIDQLSELVVDLTSENPMINCFGDNTGYITATAQGGLGNYIYTLQNTLGETIPATQNSPGVFTELIAGEYIVIVESGDCDTVSEMIELTQPNASLDATFTPTDITCSGADDGMIVVEHVAGTGTGKIQYSISPNLDQPFDDGTFTDLAPGDYFILVHDEAGCSVEYEFTLVDPTPVILGIDTIFPEVCQGEQDGSLSVEISGGSLPYSVSLDQEDGPYTTGDASQTIFMFDELSGGDHLVYVRDNQGCESVWNISMPGAINISPVAVLDYLCRDNTPGNVVSVSVDDSITDPTLLDYSLNGGPYQSSNEFVNIPPSVANYILVRHVNGCIQSTEFFDIEAFDTLELSVAEGELNQIVATATGGFGNYEYTFNGLSTGNENTYIISESGTYTVTVTDEAGCQATQEIVMEFIDVCIPNYFTPNGDGYADTWAPGCAANYPNILVKIFDRYGRTIATIGVDEDWDGRYKSKELPSGDYWYVVNLGLAENNREFVGHFTLYR